MNPSEFYVALDFTQIPYVLYTTKKPHNYFIVGLIK